MMEVQVDRKELQKLSLDFRRVAGQLLRTSFDDADANLRRFLAFIDNDAIINGFIGQKLEIVGPANISLEQIDERWNIPDDPEHEIAYVYALLQSAAKSENGHNYTTISLHYHPSSNKFQDHVNAFNKSVVQPFISHINSFIEKLMIDAGMHDRASVHVSSGGMYVGQVYGSNLAAGNATISDSTATYTDSSSLVQGIGELRSFLDEVPTDQRREAEEAVNVLVASASGEKVSKVELAQKVTFLGGLNESMEKCLIEIGVGASGGVAAHGIIAAIGYVYDLVPK